MQGIHSFRYTGIWLETAGTSSGAARHLPQRGNVVNLSQIWLVIQGYRRDAIYGVRSQRCGNLGRHEWRPYGGMRFRFNVNVIFKVDSLPLEGKVVRSAG